MEIIVFFHEKKFSDLVGFILLAKFDVQVHLVDSIERAKEILDKGKKIKLIILDYKNLKGPIDEFIGKEIFGRPYITFSNAPVGDLDPDTKTFQILAKNDFMKILLKKVEMFLKPPPQNPKSTPIPIELILYFKNLDHDISLKLSSGRLLKIFKADDKIKTADTEKLKKKGLDYLYLNPEDGNRIFEYVLSNESEAMNNLKEGKEVGLISDNDIENSLERINKIFPLDEELQKQIEDHIDGATKSIAKIPKFEKMIGKLKIRGKNIQYYGGHISLTCKIVCGMAKTLELCSDATLKKLVFVAYLHDISLMRYPHLSEINTIEKFQKVEGNLSAEEKEILLNHHEDSAALAKKFQGVPHETEDIIRDHHQIKGDIGFGEKSKNPKAINLLTAAFIIAHDLADYIYHNRRWKIDSFMEKRKYFYQQGNFKKIITAIEEKKSFLK